MKEMKTAELEGWSGRLWQWMTGDHLPRLNQRIMELSVGGIFTSKIATIEGIKEIAGRVALDPSLVSTKKITQLKQALRFLEEEYTHLQHAAEQELRSAARDHWEILPCDVRKKIGLRYWTLLEEEEKQAFAFEFWCPRSKNCGARDTLLQKFKCRSLTKDELAQELDRLIKQTEIFHSDSRMIDGRKQDPSLINESVKHLLKVPSLSKKLKDTRRKLEMAHVQAHMSEKWNRASDQIREGLAQVWGLARGEKFNQALKELIRCRNAIQQLDEEISQYEPHSSSKDTSRIRAWARRKYITPLEKPLNQLSRTGIGRVWSPVKLSREESRMIKAIESSWSQDAIENCVHYFGVEKIAVVQEKLLISALAATDKELSTKRFVLLGALEAHLEFLSPNQVKKNEGDKPYRTLALVEYWIAMLKKIPEFESDPNMSKIRQETLSNISNLRRSIQEEAKKAPADERNLLQYIRAKIQRAWSAYSKHKV